MSESNSNQNNPLEYSSKLNEFVFKFPLEKEFSQIEIPFAFQNNIDDSSGNKFHSYIKIQDSPTLCLDISNESNVDKLNLSSTIESLRSSIKDQDESRKNLEGKITVLKAESDSLKSEISQIQDEVMIRKSKLQKINFIIRENEERHKRKIKEMSDKNNERVITYKKLQEKYTNLQNEINSNTQVNSQSNQNETSDKSITSQSSSIDLEKIIDLPKEKIQQLNIEYLNSNEYLARKFWLEPYNESYVRNCLQTDLLDFQKYVKEQIKEIKPKLNQLIELIQSSTNEAIGNEYEVKLYGSHATDLCLSWSDLDVVIIHKNNSPITSYVLLHDIFKYMQEKNYFKTINYIGNTNVPLIKISTNENFNSMSIDISLQDAKHYGIQCVAYVTNLINQYEALVPMVLALKNILKQANLNDPYKGGLSSYGLILLIVFFLNEQTKHKNPITIQNGNLGRLFHEFLFFYGKQFDPSKYSINITDNYDHRNLIDSSFVKIYIFIMIIVLSTE